jgi:hypothetical protein
VNDQEPRNEDPPALEPEDPLEEAYVALRAAWDDPLMLARRLVQLLALRKP